MKKHFLILIIIAALTYSKSYAQTYGNEWINHSQKYFKIKISEEGLYGIDLNQITQAGLVTQNIDPKKFQLFNKGKEVAILVTGDSDNIFDGNDKIVFFGKPNDAALDKVLYNNPADLPNEDISLYENDNYYFLTYSNNTNGLRLKEFQQSNAGLTEENFIIAKTKINLADSYYPGEFILSAMSLSEYIEGEGYMSNTYGKGQTFNINVNTPDFFNTNSFQAQLSLYAAGRSNASSTNSNGLNHHLRVSLNSNSIFDTLFRGYKTVRKILPINITQASNQISFSALDDLGALTDFQAISYAEIMYSRGTNINNTPSLKFILNNNKALNYLRFRNSNLSNPILWDLTSDFFIKGLKNTTNADFVINTENRLKNYFLADLDNLKSTTLTNVTFRNFSSRDVKMFLMISNKLLITGVNNYKAYNDTRNIETTIAYTDDLYNEFYYGFHHPLALKNFCDWALAKGDIKPEYLLLLGKGMELSKGNFNNDLVPTIGYPASDHMLTSGLNGSNLEPGLATGRVPAKTNEEIENYLNKLKVYEGLPNEIWRKKLLHISGGNNISENISFFNYQNSLYDRAKQEFFGASIIRVRKNVSNPVTDVLTNQIVSETEKGTGLISFLGHGSSATTEIILADLNKLSNSDKPAIYLVNGCSTGAAFSTLSQSLGEQFILKKNSGAVTWIGTTSEGVASYLNNASLNCYSNWFKENYGNSISTGLKLALKEYQNIQDKLNMAHTRQFVVLGDPYVKFYSPEKPDYSLNDESIVIAPGQAAANQKLNTKIIVTNLAKATNTKVLLKISRVLPDNSQINLPDTSITIFNTDTLNISFNNSNVISAGNNKILVEINPNRSIDELSYFNNIISKEFFLPGNSVKAILPLDKSIVKTNEVKLVAQSEDLFTKSSQYLFEIDTLPDFNSSFNKKSGIITSNSTVLWTPSFEMESNKVYYWRVRLNLDPFQGGAWVTSSFTFIKDYQNNGYNAAHVGQVKNFSFDNISVSNPFLFNFMPSNMLTNIKTRGDDVPRIVEKRIRVDGFAVSYAPTDFDGITMLSFSPKKYAERFQYPSPYNYVNAPGSGFYAGPSGQYTYDIRNSVALDSLVRYLKQIPNGYHVVGFNGSNAAFNELPQIVLDEFRKIGLIKLETIKKGEPYGFWATKGDFQSVTEITADYSSPIPPNLQSIAADKPISYPGKTGKFSTDPIGPSSKWNKMELNLNNNTNDLLNLTVIGIDTLNQETNLINSINTNLVDISNIEANKYPYLKFNFQLTNNIDAQLPKTNFLRVNFEPVSDISFNPEFKSEQLKSTFQEGDSIKWDIGLKNFGPINSDSLTITYNLVGNNKTLNKALKLPFLLGANEEKSYLFKLPTIGFSGDCLLTLNLKQKNLKEDNLFNNIISKTITIQNDKIPPLISVSFDGKYITNGEIVSAKPIIKIISNDENKFLLMRDTSLIEIYIKSISDNDYKRVFFGGSDLIFESSNNNNINQINIQYKPAKFEDGVYSLKVKSKDASGNKDVKNDYIIDFEVINKQSFTSFYPYPNPVTDKMKFVFTLTGEEIPDNIKIQILTASGKIIKEISKAELGNIRIGNNVSDYTWDCTDMFGNRLANGVYFYKVIIQDANNIEHRATSGDKYFKNDIGKIYIIK